MKKSWVIVTYQRDKRYYLIAVDSTTKKFITWILDITDMETIVGAFEDLKNGGYDPFEHGHEFDEKGAVIMY